MFQTRCPYHYAKLWLHYYNSLLSINATCYHTIRYSSATSHTALFVRSRQDYHEKHHAWCIYLYVAWQFSIVRFVLTSRLVASVTWTLFSPGHQGLVNTLHTAVEHPYTNKHWQYALSVGHFAFWSNSRPIRTGLFAQNGLDVSITDEAARLRRVECTIASMQ
jgi:hypothetical protein